VKIKSRFKYTEAAFISNVKMSTTNYRLLLYFNTTVYSLVAAAGFHLKFKVNVFVAGT
jgi:hypothetical protein